MIDIDKAIRYNARARDRYWTADELPVSIYGHVLPHPAAIAPKSFAEAVESVQQALGLEADGMLGPTTWRAVTAVRGGARPGRVVTLGGEAYSFPAPVIHDRLFSGRGRTSKPHQVVMHVDVTWDSAGTYDILRARRLSSHFGVDGDSLGTLHQWLDPADSYGQHAGEANKGSIGIDVNTPLEQKYAARDKRRRGRTRPLVRAVVRGRLRTNLGFFPEQVRTLRALAAAFEEHFGIPAVWPARDGKPLADRWAGALDFRGWTGHFMFDTTHYCPGAAGLVAVGEFLELVEV